MSGIFLTASNAQYGEERTGYEGDYFSLEGAIELFKESRSISNFERKLNDEDSWVNNLDLNYDGDIDYIRVEHRSQGDFHVIVLQAILGRRDVQDVAVIEIERTGRRTAILQIIGDEDLYGEEVIAEPYNSAGYSSSGDYNFERGYVNVYHWRAVQNLFDRSYVTYVSPYRWNYYPTYWNPWHQHGWSVYHPRRVRYYNHCHIVYVHRVIRVHNFYRPFRSHSHHVTQRTIKHRRKYGTSVVHRSHGKKNQTYRTSQRSQKHNNVGTRNSTRNSQVTYQDRNKTTSPRTNRSERSTVQRDKSRTSKVSKPYSSTKRTTTSPPTRTRQVQKSQSTRSNQNKVVKTQNRSQSRTSQSQLKTRTQTRTAPRNKQQSVSQSRKQSASTRAPSRKSATTNKSRSVQKNTPKRSTSTSKNGRKGRG